jgi:hypothetical protein
VLTLFSDGKQQDRFDSNPELSGAKPSKLKPEARAARWREVLAAGHDESELAAAFASKHVFAEHALALLAPAIGADEQILTIGYNSLVRDGRPIGVRLGFRFARRPAWERRATGPTRLGSEWPDGFVANREPTRVLVGQAIQSSLAVKNQGGGSRGLRVMLRADEPCIDISGLEVVVTRTGRFQMDRYPATPIQRGELFVADLEDVELLPGFAGDIVELADASLDARMDAMNAGKVHVNIHGSARKTGRVSLDVELHPLAHPEGAYSERVVIEVGEVRGAPLRAPATLHPHELDRLTGDAHSYLLVVLDEPKERVRAHALELLGKLRDVWPKGQWHAFASNKRFEVGTRLKLKGSPRDAKVWQKLAQAIQTAKRRVLASSLAPSSYDVSGSSGFEVNVGEELGAIAIWLPTREVELAAVEALLVPAIDALAISGTLVQAILARWRIDSGGVDTPYEAVVGIHGHETACRGWGTRWLRGIGRGQLWLGPSLGDRVGAGDLQDAIAIGRSSRVAVTDVVQIEQRLAVLLPSLEDFEAFRDQLDDEADE